MPAIEYIHGCGYVYDTRRSPKHEWAFEIRGLESFAVNQVAPLAYEGYRYWIAGIVPERILFTVAEHDGSKQGAANLCRFSICEVVSDEPSSIKARYGNCRVEGDFRIVAHANAPIRSQRLYEWWYRYCPEQTLAYAEHCAAYLEKQWTKKKLPPMEDSIEAILRRESFSQETIDILLKSHALAQQQKTIRVYRIDSVLDEWVKSAADNRQVSADRIIEEALRAYFKHFGLK